MPSVNWAHSVQGHQRAPGSRLGQDLQDVRTEGQVPGQGQKCPHVYVLEKPLDYLPLPLLLPPQGHPVWVGWEGMAGCSPEVGFLLQTWTPEACFCEHR